MLKYRNLIARILNYETPNYYSFTLRCQYFWHTWSPSFKLCMNISIPNTANKQFECSYVYSFSQIAKPWGNIWTIRLS